MKKYIYYFALLALMPFVSASILTGHTIYLNNGQGNGTTTIINNTINQTIYINTTINESFITNNTFNVTINNSFITNNTINETINQTIYINTTLNNTYVNNFTNGTGIGLDENQSFYILTSFLDGLYYPLNNNPAGYLTSANVSPFVKLNNVISPTANTEWNMGIFSLNITFTGALAKGIDIDGIGAFSDDLLHIHQHSGNVPAGTDLLHIEAEDVDARGINVTTAGEESIRANHNITADWINAKINASNIINTFWATITQLNTEIANRISNDTTISNIELLNNNSQEYRINGAIQNATTDNHTQGDEIALRLRNNSIKDYYNDGIVINLTNGETITGALNVTAPNGSYINIVSHNSNPSGIMLINGTQQLGQVYASADTATAFPATSLHLRSPTVNGISMETSNGFIARFGITQIQFITQALNMSNHDIFAVNHLNVSEIFIGSDFTVSHQLLNVTGITTIGDIKMQERGSIYDAINISLDNMLVINGTQYTIIEKSSVGATQWNISIPTGYRSAMIKMLLHPSNPATVGMRFNNDNALNYASRRSANSGADTAFVSSREFNITAGTSASTFISATVHIDGLDNSGTTVGTFQTQDRGNTVATAFNRWEGGFAYFNATNIPITTINILSTASFQTDGVAYITLYK